MERNLTEAGNLNHDAIIHHANTHGKQGHIECRSDSVVCERERG